MSASLQSRFAHVPVSLAFGTSGLRGLVKDITDLEAYVNVRGAIEHLLAEGDIAPRSTVLLGGDLRPSTERIMRACAHALRDAGCEVENAGKLPTPALIAHALAGGHASVMVTGSHIPFDRNGIKLTKRAGEVLKADEAGILRAIARTRAAEYARAAETSPFDAAGMLRRPAPLPPIEPAAAERYVKRYLDAFPAGGLAGTRVLVYQHSAVGRDLLPRILRGLGADVLTAGRSETFVAIDTENIADAQLARLEELTRDAAGDGLPLAAIVSTDGDSDRPLVTAVLDPAEAALEGRGVRFLSGDLLGIIVAEYLHADAAAVPISANDAVDRRMRERGVVLKKTKIGSPHVIVAMDELARGGTHRRVMGWEANGGFLTQSALEIAGGTPLPPLPTRDAVLPILANLFAAAEKHSTLAALWNHLPARFGRAGLLDDVPVSVSRVIVEQLSGTDGKALAARYFSPALGFDGVLEIDPTDGARITFQNGDVAHVRASGNAPQLRVYSTSDTQARATEIVDAALAEPEGVLRQLERALT